jgi:hypothetical protein
VVVSLLVLGVTAGPALAARAQSFSGTFVGEGSEKVVLRQRGSEVRGEVVVAGMKGKLSGKASGHRLAGRITLPWGDAAGFSATLAGDTLKLRLEGDPTVGVYRRQGRAPAAALPAPGAGTAPAGRNAAAPSPAPAPAGSGGASALSARGAKARGRVYRSEYQGWSIRLAPGWDGREKDGVLFLGHRREAGLIVVEATSERDPEALRAGLAQDLMESGLMGQVPALSRSRMPAGTGVAASFPVRSRDGKALMVRAAGVIGPRGAVAVLGTTTREHFETLASRVDAMARSVRFFRPKVAPGRRVVLGEWYAYSGVGSFTGGGGGTESRMAFCPDGTFRDTSESSYYGSGSVGGTWGVAGSPQSSAGRWRVEGGTQSGRIIITYPGDRESVITYQARGSDMTFDGKLYAHTRLTLCR